MNKKEIEALITWWKESDTQGMDVDKYFLEPLTEALGDDIDAILKYLDSMDVETLDYISGCFEFIYGKFTTDEVWDALEKLEEKIDRAKEDET